MGAAGWVAGAGLSLRRKPRNSTEKNVRPGLCRASLRPGHGTEAAGDVAAFLWLAAKKRKLAALHAAYFDAQPSRNANPS